MELQRGNVDRCMEMLVHAARRGEEADCMGHMVLLEGPRKGGMLAGVG